MQKWPILKKIFFEFWPKWPNFAFRYFQMTKKLNFEKNSQNGLFLHFAIFKLLKNGKNLNFLKKEIYFAKNKQKWPIFEKKFFEILTRIWNFQTKTPPKTAENGLKWPKMAKNELCFDFEKKIFEKFWKIFWHFYTKTIPRTAKNGLKLPKNRFVLIFE